MWTSERNKDVKRKDISKTRLYHAILSVQRSRQATGSH